MPVTSGLIRVTLALLLAAGAHCGEALAQAVMPGPFQQEATPPEAEGEKPEARRTLSYAEIYQILLNRGLTEEAARQLLRDYPQDKTFTDVELDAILRRVRPEDLLIRQKKEERAPEAEAPGVLPQIEEGRREPLPFGYDIFKRAPEKFEPGEDLAVGPEYRLGPGDELRISLWGSVQQEYTALVDREGNVTLPEVGVVSAAGMTLGAFEESITREFHKALSGFKLAVSLRRLRRIQVIVAGEAVRPGAYLLSPTSTTFNAVYFAGGPTPRGSLRRVRIVRDGRIVAEVDLYQYLLGGETPGDVKLLSGDTVFIMARQSQATLRGEIHRPAIFELRGGETVGDLLAMGGGFTSTAYPRRATLDRVSPATGPVTVELDLSAAVGDSAGGSMLGLPLQDGDDLTVYSIYHLEPRQFVEIQGMVQYPGIYPLYPGMTVSDLVFRAGGLLDSAYRLKAEISRLHRIGEPRTVAAVGDTVAQVIAIELDQAVSAPRGTPDPVLVKDDKLFIRKIPGWKLQETVKVSGQVRFPGIYPLVVRQERVHSVIDRTGGPTPQAFLKGASLFRKDEGRVIINFEKALEDSTSRENITLVDGDSINVPAYPPTILVEGEVGRPGSLLFEPGKSASYYLDRTGGASENGDLGRTRIYRVNGVVQKAFRKFWWDPSVDAGARIVVPRRLPEKGVNWGSAIRDASTILASLVTTVYIVTQINKK